MDLNLANIGDDTATYAISLIQIRMTEEGGFETITEPDEGQMFASPYMRYFPRTVTLGPNEAQTVKIQLVKKRQAWSPASTGHISISVPCRRRSPLERRKR
ncbi:MAG: hypothetical protein MZV63_71745 [Marinilabiliales bacterium]|nr:hypothetical protein [Marinilabiliales bacterium]